MRGINGNGKYNLKMGIGHKKAIHKRVNAPKVLKNEIEILARSKH